MAPGGCGVHLASLKSPAALNTAPAALNTPPAALNTPRAALNVLLPAVVNTRA